VDVGEVIERAQAGKPEGVFVLSGEERFLVERAIRALREATIGDGPTGLNDEVIHGSKTTEARSIAAAARTLPMMAKARFVLVRDVHLMAAGELDALVDYLEDPSPSSCVVMTAVKLDGRGRFAKQAKKLGVLVDAQPLRPADMRRFLSQEAKARGHALDAQAAEALVDAIGTDLAAADDAMERLSLFVGAGAAIDLASVEACITRVRTESIWALVDAVSGRDRRKAVTATGSLLADREPPLRILAMVARQLRMVAKMREALAAGLAGPEAAKRAGAPPFKARELTAAARRFTMKDLEHAFRVLAQADLAMKGAKRKGELVLEETILALCTEGVPPQIAVPPLRP
jgi:DNA polymerase-3 subunit delta